MASIYRDVIYFTAYIYKIPLLQVPAILDVCTAGLQGKPSSPPWVQHHRHGFN